MSHHHKKLFLFVGFERSNKKEKFYNQILSKIFQKIYIEEFEKIAAIYKKIFPKAKIYITSNYKSEYINISDKFY